MNRKISLGVAITFTVVLLIATFCLTMIFSNHMFNSKLSNIKDREQMYEKLAEIDTIVRRKYDGKIDSKVLFDHLSAGYMAGLNDPYAVYLTAEEYKNVLQTAEGEAAGIGATVYAEASGYLTVGEVLEDSPASEAGLQPGDLIVKVNDVPCTAANAEQSIASLGGKAGTTVSITYRRAAEDKVLELVRKQFDPKTVVSKELTPKIGLIRILSFNKHTASQFQEAVKNLSDKGCTAYVLDVRNTATDQIDAVCQVLEQIIPEGPLAVAQYQSGTTEILYKSKQKTTLQAKFIVLMNGKTAQGGELFASVLKDYGLAGLVGDVTAGKGVVQDLVPLSDGSAIRVTTALLAAPKSKSFNLTGLTPDYAQSLPADNLNAVHSMDPEQDIQLKKAVTVLNEMIGGDKPSPEEPSETASESSSESSSEAASEDSSEEKKSA